MNKIRALGFLCIHVKKIQGPAQFRTKALRMPRYKKKLCTTLENYALVHKSGLSGGLTIQNGENREFLSVLEARRESAQNEGRNNANAVPLHEWMISS